MTKRERAQLEEAVRCFNGEPEDWEGGMRILARLLKVKPKKLKPGRYMNVLNTIKGQKRRMKQ